MRGRVVLLILSAGFHLSVGAQNITIGDPPPLSLSSAGKKVHLCKPGPWGDLEYYYTYLEAPSHIMELINTPSPRTVWTFPDKDAPQLKEFLLTSGLPVDQVQSILQDSIPFQKRPPFLLYPSSKIIESMPPATRQAIYTELRKWPQNKTYRQPIIIESGNIREWFSGSDLSVETIALIEKLAFKIGNSTVFSDIPTVLSYLHHDYEDRAFMKALTRTRSLILHLKITEDSDIEALKDYWSAGSRYKDIFPLLESAASSTIASGEQILDAAHIIPPTPRKYLYTFPTLSLGIDGTFPDGFWTSLNFFNYLPDEQFDNVKNVMAYARENFLPASPPYKYGDMLLLIDPVANKSIHACIYIADDIVYTKNGRSILQPFMFMKMSDLLTRFSGELSPTVEAWRKIAN